MAIHILVRCVMRFCMSLRLCMSKKGMPNINRDIHGNTHFSAMCNRDFVCLLDFVCLVARYDQGIQGNTHFIAMCN